MSKEIKFVPSSTPLNNSFQNFVKSSKENKTPSKFRKAVEEVNQFIILNREKVDIATELAKSLTQFAIHKTPFTLIEGVLGTIRAVTLDNGNYYGTDFFSDNNGWRPLSYDGVNFSGMFSSILKKFPSKSLRFQYDNTNNASIIDLPGFQIGLLQNKFDASLENLFFKYEEVNAEQALDFLITEKLKLLDTNIISLEFGSSAYSDGGPGNNLFLMPETIFPIKSEKADFYTAYLKKCIDLGINRSIMFHGQPGTGKTTLCQTIIHNLGLRTLKFRYSSAFNFSIFAFIIRKFNIEAVMMDDFDQCDSSESLLEFLEMLNKETKVVIGLANSLQEFHPALLRPDRFDEITVVDSLDSTVVKEIIGPKLTKKYFARIKDWPIAYINEFVTRSQILSPAELNNSFTELSKRVEKNLERLK